MQNPSSTVTPSSYRPDIDGLRAVAVLLVLFNHIEIHRFAGGFIGVDVFFVISGFLIGAHILNDIDAGDFSLLRFYQRRFRRIVPALLAVLIFTTFLAQHYLFPAELISFGQSEIGALFSYSNVVFSQQSGYFDMPSRLKPLLHTWSLGVEEQFYIVFPLLLLFLCRIARKRLAASLTTLTMLLLALACYWTFHDRSAAFFLAPFRAWELLLGTLLVLGVFPNLSRPWQRNLASAAGLLGILVPALLYTDKTPFPGLAALAPCLGTALIIAAGQSGSSAVGSLLASRPFRGIGLISYSLYLWHWPLQVFQTTNRILVPDRFPLWVSQTAVAVASLILATLSWRFVEQPFRTGRFRRTGVPVFAVAAVLVIVIFDCAQIFATYGWYLPPTMPRSAAYTEELSSLHQPPSVRYGTCYMDSRAMPASFQRATCLAEVPGQPQYLLLGDSHAGVLYPGLHQVFPDLNLSQINAPGCTPTLRRPFWVTDDCSAAEHLTYDDFLSKHSVNTVLLVARWTPDDLPFLGDTIAWLHDRHMKVIVFGPAIEFDQSLVRLLETSRRDHDPGALVRHRNMQLQSLDQRMALLAHNTWHVGYISIYQDLCAPVSQLPAATETSAGCPVYGAPGLPLLYDTDHLSPSGTLLFAQQIKARHQLP